MPTDRAAGSFDGFGRSALFTATIASGQTTTTALDLLRNYAYLVVSCLDASKIAAASNLRLQVAEETAASVADLWASDGSAIWQSGVLPTSGTFRFVIPSAFGVQLVKPVLTVAASGGSVVLNFYGFDPTAQAH